MIKDKMRRFWSKKSYRMPTILLVSFTVLFVAYMFNGLSYRAISVDTENYAFKDLNGHHSPYLVIGSMDDYLVDWDINMIGKPVEGFEAVGEYDGTDDGLFNTEDEKGSILELVGREGRLLYGIGGDMFNHISVTNEKWDSDKAIAETDKVISSLNIRKNIQENAGKLIEGAFNWDYRNKDNRENFLAFRVGEYIYKERMVSVDLMYDRIHESLRERKVITQVKFNEEDIKVYIHPRIGGFMVESPIELTVSEGGNEKVYQMVYLADLAFKTPSPRDVWTLWEKGVNGVQMVAAEYVREEMNVNE